MLYEEEGQLHAPTDPLFLRGLTNAFPEVN